MKVKQIIHYPQSKVAQTKAASQNIQIRMNIVKYVSMVVQLCPVCLVIKKYISMVVQLGPVSGLWQRRHWSVPVDMTLWTWHWCFCHKKQALTMRCHPTVTGTYIRAGKCIMNLIAHTEVHPTIFQRLGFGTHLISNLSYNWQLNPSIRTTTNSTSKENVP